MPLNQDQFRAIISGRRRDAAAVAVRSLLGAATFGYGLAVRIRNALYDHHVFKTHRVNAAVLSIGNLTTGGTGKTPLVVWLCRELAQCSAFGTQHYRVAVLTRGYKSTQHSAVSRQYSDEPAILARACGDVPVIVNPDRVAGAKAAMAKGAEVLVMDDGFQHRRLARDLDVVAIDATLPFGYDRLLPAGLLREPPTALSRAQAAVITRSDFVRPDQLEQIERTLREVNPRLVVARAIHAPVAIQLADGHTMTAADLAGKRVYAFCGIGNPEAFFQTIEAHGAHLVGTMSFNDHYLCTAEDIRRVLQQAATAKADLVLTTEKNWLGLEPSLFDERQAAGYLEIRLEVTAGRDALIRLIRARLDSRIPV